MDGMTPEESDRVYSDPSVQRAVKRLQVAESEYKNQINKVECAVWATMKKIRDEYYTPPNPFGKV